MKPRSKTSTNKTPKPNPWDPETPLQEAALGSFSTQIMKKFKNKWPLIEKHFHEKVLSLLEKGADPNARNNDGQTALHFAVNGNKILSVKTLLKYGADPTIECSCAKMNPLHFALSEGHWECARLLIKAGAPLKPKSMAAGSALCSVCGFPSIKTVRYLLKQGVNVNFRDEEGIGWTPLHFAAAEDMSSHVAITNLLLESGANPRIKDKRGRTALDVLREWSSNNQKIPEEMEKGWKQSLKYYKRKELMILKSLAGRVPSVKKTAKRAQAK